MKEIINLILHWIVTFSPKNAFISDVIAVQGAVIAIALPLSLEIISRISERYQSGVITKKFNQRWEIKLLPKLLIADIFMGVTLKFFGQNDSIDGYWKFVAWLTFFFFLITTGVLYLFFGTLRRYTTETSFLLEELLKDMEESLSPAQQKGKIDRKALIRKQKRLVEALEGVGDILVFDTKNKKRDRDIEKGLNKIGDKIKQFLDMQKNRPEEFEILLLSEDYINIHDKNPRDAQLLLAFDAEKHLITFTTAVNQILRIRETSLEVKNFEIGRFAIYHIIWLLEDLCQIPNNGLLVEQLLKYLANIRRNNDEKQDDSAYYVSVRWYISVVFKKDFDIFSYQGLLDKYFFYSIQYLVSQGQTNIFELMVSSLIDSGDIRGYGDYINIDRYEDLLINLNYQQYNEFIQNSKLQIQIENFKRRTHHVLTVKSLKDYLEAIADIEELIQPYFDIYPKDEFEKIGNTIRESFICEFKYKNLIDIIFSAGAYCIFKQRYDYINYLWNYKQPPDSDATWIGHDIVPGSLNFLIDFYFRTYIYEKKFNLSWENHHGSELYYKQYFLLLLLREFQKSGTNNRQQLINNFRLPDLWDSHYLSNINFSVDNLVEIARGLKNKMDALKIIGFDTTRVVDDIDLGLIPFLESLKPQVDLQLKKLLKAQNISYKKVDEFKQQFINEFTKTTVVRKIISFLGLYENKINDTSTTQSFYGINETISKEAFFEEWYSHWLNPGGEWGRSLARDEDSKIIDDIENSCEEADINQFEETLGLLKDNLQNVIIIAVNFALNRFIINNAKFTPNLSDTSNLLETRSLKGYYKYENYDIPVFEVYCNKSGGRILILDKSKLGKLTQYSPIQDGDSENLTDIFYISVQAFSENETLMNTFLQNPPHWLTQKGDQVQQRDYLEEKAVIKIYENFQFEKHQDFNGYLLKLPNSDASNRQSDFSR